MNPDVINNNLQKIIRNVLSSESSVTNTLMDILPLGREAIYRRLRGEVPFSLYEASLIAKKLNLSLDVITDMDIEVDTFFKLEAQKFYDMQDSDFLRINDLIDLLGLVSKEPMSQQVFIANTFSEFPSHMFYSFVQYTSFRWTCLNSELVNIVPFHEMNFSEKMYMTSQELVSNVMKIKDTSYIWDRSIFNSMVQEIKYFSSVNLIDEKSVKMLKTDLFRLLDYLEKIAETGEFETGNKVHLYIANISIGTKYYCLESENTNFSMIGAFALDYVISKDKKAFEKTKSVIQYLKRVSSLISGCGEIERRDFFINQRKIVNTL